MKLVQTTMEEVAKTSRNRKNRGDLYDFLEEFISSDMQVAEIIIQPEEYKDAYTAAGTLKGAINRYKLNIICTTRNHHIYLIRK